MQSQSDRDARIRDRAYQIWLSQGRRHGQHDAHWQQAEREIQAEEVSTGGRKAGAAKPARSKTKPPVASEASPVTVSRARAKDDAAAKKPRTGAAAAVSDAAAPARRGQQHAPAKSST
jgi:hypothetical protein